MTNELVKSLRDYSEGPSSYWLPICRKAADLIEQLDADCLLLQCERDMLKQQRADWKAVADSRPIRAAVEPFDELERYKRALYQANGMLIQLDKEPVKLDYSSVTKAAEL
jgi:hypothetical protein